MLDSPMLPLWSGTDKSIAFYRRYAGMEVIHQREPGIPDARKVAWLSDRTRPFALVLVQADTVTDTPLGHFGHLGVACATREEIDRKTEMAMRTAYYEKRRKTWATPSVYYVFCRPDGNTLELSFGQRVGLEAIRAENQDARSRKSRRKRIASYGLRGFQSGDAGISPG
jgi:catechol 2,3-dioxygenase-like lactoylglutathione lyase family enzyme